MKNLLALRTHKLFGSDLKECFLPGLWAVCWSWGLGLLFYLCLAPGVAGRYLKALAYKQGQGIQHRPPTS